MGGLDPDAYVVRAGWRGFCVMLLALLGWTGLSAGVLHGHHLASAVPAIAILGLFEAVILVVAVRRAWLAARRTIVFAVDGHGVLFADGPAQERVPWSAICAVELFTERTQGSRAQVAYRCVGVRSAGTRQVPRPGNGPAAQPLPGRGAEAIVRAGRPDLIPGYDGTIRYAYRRMSGWRVSRMSLARAVQRYAPQVPVIDGPAYPPALTWSGGRARDTGHHAPVPLHRRGRRDP